MSTEPSSPAPTGPGAAPRRGWEGTVLKLLRAKDFRLTVTDTTRVTPGYLRLGVEDGGLLAACGHHPTMWVRLWFEDGGRPHQRAFTLVDPDPAAGRFSLEFALHEGPAARWATGAAPGDTVEATVMGTKFVEPPTPPSRIVAVGDPASLPAINSLLAAYPDVPAHVVLEHATPDDATLPVRSRPGDVVVRVGRTPDPAAITGAFEDAFGAGPAAPGDYVWIAAEASLTRRLTAHARETLGVHRKQLASMAYWRA